MKRYIVPFVALALSAATLLFAAAGCSTGGGSGTPPAQSDVPQTAPISSISSSNYSNNPLVSTGTINDRTSSLASLPSGSAQEASSETEQTQHAEPNEQSQQASDSTNQQELSSASVPASEGPSAETLKIELGIIEDYRPSLSHGEKGAEYQRYIMLHDTEGDSSPQSVIDWWDSNGNLVAAHFVVGKDGSVAQCVPMDSIAHHAGFGDAGHNTHYGVEDESRDDKLGTTPIGPTYPDYGMNSYSIGIEMVHIGGEGYYPEEQLAAVDKLIAYIDAYYGGTGKGGTIIDHKMWRTSNGDTSPEFAEYLANYQDHRTHN